MRIRKVVVGIDFGEASAAVLRWTTRHLAPGRGLLLVHAGEADTPAADVLERLRELALASGAGHALLEVAQGDAAGAVASAARAFAADLVVAGAPGPRRGVARIVGGTAERLVHLSPAPVLFARGGLDGPPRRLLVPVDDAPASRGALAWTGSLASLFGADATVVHAVEPLTAVQLRRAALASLPGSGLEEEFRRERRRWLRSALREAGLGRSCRRVYLASGDPVHAIVRTAGECGADLIVMGSRGPGTVERALTGSMAADVVQAAGCSVLVVSEAGWRARPPREVQQGWHRRGTFRPAWPRAQPAAR